ncbi:hypothetical protein GQX74_002172 [Glossina fuscipes]|nr:hypothetical protein GQX74_002172 [Glossina fuscipes]
MVTTFRAIVDVMLHSSIITTTTTTISAFNFQYPTYKIQKFLYYHYSHPHYDAASIQCDLKSCVGVTKIAYIRPMVRAPIFKIGEYLGLPCCSLRRLQFSYQLIRVSSKRIMIIFKIVLCSYTKNISLMLTIAIMTNKCMCGHQLSKEVLVIFYVMLSSLLYTAWQNVWGDQSNFA